MTNARTVILIADDNQQNLELIDAYLTPLKSEILHAHDGVETLEMVAKNRPDLIVLDVMMPRLSGFEVCRRLREDPSTANIPIIMVTALHDKPDIERSVEVGADDFLSKPIVKEDLLERVAALMSVRNEPTGLKRTLKYIGELERS